MRASFRRLGLNFLMEMLRNTATDIWSFGTVVSLHLSATHFFVVAETYITSIANFCT